MPTNTLTVPVADLAEIVGDPTRGIISLVGGHGGLALIVGDIEASSLMMGSLAVETEHGTIYLDPDGDVQISETTPYPDEHEWLVEWCIDGYGATPEAAARAVWRDVFGRTSATDEEACVFWVTDPTTGQRTKVDLSDTGSD